MGFKNIISLDRRYMKNKQNWEEKYKDKFGLCDNYENCDCNSEIRFIKSLLSKARTATIQECLERVGKMKKPRENQFIITVEEHTLSDVEKSLKELL